jgi:dTMP kinase
MGLAATAKRFPDRTTATGQIINQYLQSKSTSSSTSSSTSTTSATHLSDQAIHLLFSANRWEAAEPIKELLQAGTHIVCDRYAFSGVAFSAAKPNMSLSWCMAPDVGLPAPDCVVFLDLSPEQAEQRGGYGQERYETQDFQTAVRQQFTKLQNYLPEHTKERSSSTSSAAAAASVPWHVVNAAQSMEQVEQDIWSIVEPMLPAVAQQPIGQLWVSNDQENTK